eukprot:CAMPEP_0171325722 /NCGR_PEP_ID=MMETSP0816-20121228/116991_1 /TAXON_ID=420281 /ORGANISM="Proboscia inermis, Strain CCAP1064/1" /LENGTH=237 /DNA_ID=CAMNT_0011824977 /DNA_START=21 /DNA_END=734 /DNA_ORIENTATION=+
MTSKLPGPHTLKEIITPPNVDDLYEWYCARNLFDEDPSWAVVWPTAVSLSTYLIEFPDLVRGKRVVELGCGLGVAGMTAACLGAQSVILTDRDGLALHCAMSTVACNQLNEGEQRIKAAIVDWTDEESLLRCGDADVVLASDVLYDEETIIAFGRACRTILSKGGRVLVTDPLVERKAGCRELLRQELDKENAEIKVVDLGSPGGDLPSSSPDGKDHDRRMKESILLIQYKLSVSKD